MVQIDPTTNQVVATVSDEHSPSGPNELITFGGNLFQLYDPAGTMVQRDLSTGEYIKQTDLSGSACCGWAQQGFGSIWRPYREPYALIDRIDPTSGKVTKTLNPGIQMRDFAVGDRAVYLLDYQGQVHEIDPVTNQEAAVFPSQAVTGPEFMWYSGGKLYFPDGPPGDLGLTVVDATTHQLVHRWTGRPLSGYTEVPNGAVDPFTGTVWLVNQLDSSLTPFEVASDHADTSTGLATQPQAVAAGFGSIWIAAGANVYRVDPTTHRIQKTFAMPDGGSAGWIVMDTANSKIWVSNCHGPFC